MGCSNTTMMTTVHRPQRFTSAMNILWAIRSTNMGRLARASGFASVGFCLAMAFGTAQAQQVDPEWPCVQRLVPTVSPATMWPLPVDDNMMQSWAADDIIRPLAEHLGDLPELTDQERLAIQEFSENEAESDLEMRLTLLAAGVVDVTNRVRGKYIKGIKRYTKQQIAISHQIEDSLNQLSLLGDKDDADSLEKRTTIRDTLKWHERVYDQREHSIRLLCEQPVELEQRLSSVLREVAQYLP